MKIPVISFVYCFPLVSLRHSWTTFLFDLYRCLLKRSNSKFYFDLSCSLSLFILLHMSLSCSCSPTPVSIRSVLKDEKSSVIINTDWFLLLGKRGTFIYSFNILTEDRPLPSHRILSSLHIVDKHRTDNQRSFEYFSDSQSRKIQDIISFPHDMRLPWSLVFYSYFYWTFTFR